MTFLLHELTTCVFIDIPASFEFSQILSFFFIDISGSIVEKQLSAFIQAILA